MKTHRTLVQWSSLSGWTVFLFSVAGLADGEPVTIAFRGDVQGEYLAEGDNLPFPLDVGDSIFGLFAFEPAPAPESCQERLLDLINVSLDIGDMKLGGPGGQLVVQNDGPPPPGVAIAAVHPTPLFDSVHLDFGNRPLETDPSLNWNLSLTWFTSGPPDTPPNNFAGGEDLADPRIWNRFGLSESYAVLSVAPAGAVGLHPQYHIRLDPVAVPLEANIPVGMTGDYNLDGLVDQSDLELVLLNWGQEGAGLPDDWIQSIPSGLVDQAELNAVLLNWGNQPGGAAAVAGTPEPNSMALACIVLMATALLWRRLS